MIFDFTNYTFSGLLSILASLYGVSYPLIMQSIGRIYTQYDSTLLANRFTKETIYRVFQVLLVLNLLFAVSTPFLLHAEWWNIGFVTIQAILLVLLMGFTFLLFQLMIKYENAEELLHDASLSIAEIAMNTGFTSQSYFTKLFKQKYGMPPNTYRKKV